MHSALSSLAQLPDQTIVYNGHEYTASNLAFAKSVDPLNPAIARLGDIVEKNKVTTGLTTIGDEKAWNVFMRLKDDVVMYVFLLVSLCLHVLITSLAVVKARGKRTRSRS